jgi:Carboxypeptidase regulatory-like domain
MSLQGKFASALSARIFTSAISTGVILCLIPSLAFGQANLGRLSGTVRDQSGGSIVGAMVSLIDADRGPERDVITDEAGGYVLPGLIPGRKTIRAEFRGFRSFEQANVVLGVGQDARLDIVLQPGALNETIRVTEAPPLLDTTSAELGGTIENQAINDLPLNGRNFENLLDLRPGVTKYPGNSGWTQSTNGMRPHDNYFMVDGINSNDPWMAQSMMNAVMAAGDAGTILPIDAIDEFRTQENPRAEFGWKPGAVVNVGIKSGTNQIHGTAYAYGRDGSWDALDFFPAPAPQLDLEQFGGSVGGPIKKDKLFFFGNFEAQRYNVGNPVPHELPVTAAGVGDPTKNLIGACNLARGAGTLTALSAQLAGLSTSCSPLSNYPGLFPVNPGSNPSDPNSFSTSIPSTNHIYSGLGKIDYHPSSKHTISGIYFISPGDGTFVDAPTIQIAQPWLTVQYARSQVGSGTWLWTPTSNLVNSFRFGYSHYYQTFNSADGSQNPANYNYNGSTYHLYTGQTNPAYYGLPQISFQGGFSSFVLGASWPKTVGPDGIYQISDSVSILRGNHSFKFGGEVLINQSTNNVTANTKGPLRFSNLESFFAGDMNRVRYTAGDFLRHLQNQAYGLFVQDDWRLSRTFTVNLGVRYELNTVFTESNNLMGNFDPNLGLVQVGKQIGAPFHGDHNNFAPRVGLAWDIGGNGKTVIRAGGGIFYEQASYDSFMAIGNLLGLRTVPTGVSIYTNGNQTPFTAGGTINLGAITFTGPALGPIKSAWTNNGPNNPLYNAQATCGDGSVTLPNGLTPSPCDVMGVDRNIRTPYVTNWNIGVQRAITQNLSLDVTYVGNHATKLFGLTDLNQPQLVNGYSPGWGNPNVIGTPAQQCIASAPAYDNCAPDNGAETAAQPFNAKFPYLGYIYWLSNSNFSNYNGLQASLTQRSVHGVSFVAGYTFAHSLSQSPDNWSFLVPIDSNHVRNLYGSSQFDIRHHFTFSVTYALPSVKAPAQLLSGWSINSIVNLQTSAPWGINDFTTDFSGTNEISNASTNGEQWDFFGNPSDFKTTKAFLNPGSAGAVNAAGIPFFPGASNPKCLAKSQSMGPLAVASLANLGCYAAGNSILIPPAFGSYGTTGPNIFRSFPYYNVDLSVTKGFKIRERINMQFRAEFFNILNHPNISNVFGGPGGDNTYTDPSTDIGGIFGARPQTPDVTSSNPLLGSGGPRAIQLGLKIVF